MSSHAAPKAGHRDGSFSSWAEYLVRVLDDGLQVPGTRLRFGLDAIVGLVFPGVGDALTTGAGLSLFWLALQRGAPAIVLARMVLNVAIDSVVGIVPVLGDVFDFGWKANRKNLRLLERHGQGPRSKHRISDYLVVGVAVLCASFAIIAPFALVIWLIERLRAAR